MINIIKKSAIGTIASFVLAVPAIALAVEDYPFMDEVNSCVAESLTRVDTSGASRVRHVVTDYRRSALGYALKIQTSIFSGDQQANYSIYCVVNGDHAPIKFRIKDLNV